MFRRPYPWRVALRPVLRWSVVLALAGAAAALAGRAVAQGRLEQQRWGASRPALVARTTIEAGDPLDDRNTTTVDLPTALIGDETLSGVPTGAVAAGHMAAGEIVRRDRLGRPYRSPVAALVPPGRQGVAVPRGDDVLPLVVGDRVRIVAAVRDVPGAPSSAVADDALVVHVGEHSAVVAVTDAELPAVARALADGAAVLALSG